MSVIDFVQLESWMVALTLDGFLVLWSTCHEKPVDQVSSQLPFLASEFQYKITGHKPRALLKGSKSLYVITDRDIRQFTIASLEAFLKKYRNSTAKEELPMKTLRQESEILKAIIINSDKVQQLFENEMLDQSLEQSVTAQAPYFECIIFSTKSKVLVTDWQLSRVAEVVALPATEGTGIWNEHITCMLPFREESLLLAGTSAGRLLVVSLAGARVMEDITAKNQLRLGGVREVVMWGSERRFYSLHDNAIVEWSLELQKCLGYYAYSTAYSVLQTSLMVADAPKLLVAGPGRCLEIIDPTNPSQKTQYETSLESIYAMQEVKGMVACGGSHGMIEFIQKGVTCLILFRS